MDIIIELGSLKLSCYYKYIFHSQIDNYFSKKNKREVVAFIDRNFSFLIL